MLFDLEVPLGRGLPEVHGLTKKRRAFNAASLQMSVTFSGQRFWARSRSFARLAPIVNTQVFSEGFPSNVSIFVRALR